MIVDTFGVGIPSQIFSATLAVSERVKLGLAQEYALRLTSILGGARLEDFRTFFGLSKDETNQLISWLVRDEYLEHDDGLFVLGTRGEAAFFTEGDDLPRIVRPTEVTETIALERVGGSLVPKLVSKVPRYVPVLSETYIKQYDRNQVAIAIERHFAEWLKTWPKRGSLGFKETLYSVLDVNSERHFTSREEISVRAKASPGQLDVELDFGEMQRRGATGAHDALVGAIRNHLSTAHYPDDTDAGLRFLQKFDDGTLARFRRMKVFDLQRWIVEGRNDPAGTLTFTGSLAANEAREFILSILSQDEVAAEADGKPRVYAPIIWVRPSHNQWGTAIAYEDFWRKLKIANRARGGLLLASAGQNTRGGLSGRAESDLIGDTKAFESAIIADTLRLPQVLEFVIDPGRWLIAICYGRYGPERLPIGAGMATVRPEIVSAGTRIVCQELLSALSAPAVRHGDWLDYDVIRNYVERLASKPLKT